MYILHVGGYVHLKIRPNGNRSNFHLSYGDTYILRRGMKIRPNGNRSNFHPTYGDTYRCSPLVPPLEWAEILPFRNST